MTNMSFFELNAKIRTHTGKKAKNLFEEKRIPAVLYGKKIESQNVSVARTEFEKVYSRAGASSLIELAIEGGESAPVLIQDIARCPRANSIIHIDFYKVNMAEKLVAHVPLKFIGESKAIKELGGILVKSIKNIEVKCLPKDLVSEISVDIGALGSFEDSILVKDLDIPAGMELVAHAQTIVASVISPISEDELKKSLEGKPEANVDDVKVEERGKKEENLEQK